MFLNWIAVFSTKFFYIFHQLFFSIEKKKQNQQQQKNTIEASTINNCFDLEGSKLQIFYLT